MKTTTISNTYIEYPERITWLKDSNVINLVSSTNVGAEVTITTSLSESHTLVYFSDTNKLMFVLDDVLHMLYAGSTSPWNIQVRVYESGLPVGTLGFYIYVLDGKSFITRSHGMSSTIYVYSQEDLHKVQIYSPANGQATIGNWSDVLHLGLTNFELDTVIQNAGEYSLCLSSSSSVPSTVVITNDTPVDPHTSILDFQVINGYDPEAKEGGDLWEAKTIFPMCYKIIYPEVCSGYDFAEIRYTDTDGCIRQLGGKLINEVDSAKDESWNTISTSIYNSNPHRWIQSSEKTIKIAFSDIERAAYPADIMYSDSIWVKTWDNEWREARLKTSSMETTNDEYLDFELELYVHSI